MLVFGDLIRRCSACLMVLHVLPSRVLSESVSSLQVPSVHSRLSHLFRGEAGPADDLVPAEPPGAPVIGRWREPHC